MSDSTAITSGRTLPVRRTGVATIALWSTQLLLAAMFLFSGGSKLAGAAAMVALFDAIGIGQWFRYVTGTTHLFIVGGSPAVPVVLLLGAMAVAWARRDQLARAFARAR